MGNGILVARRLIKGLGEGEKAASFVWLDREFDRLRRAAENSETIS